jgi:hypothetical protein
LDIQNEKIDEYIKYDFFDEIGEPKRIDITIPIALEKHELENLQEVIKRVINNFIQTLIDINGY